MIARTVSGGKFGIYDWQQVKIGMTPQILLFLAFLAAFAVRLPRVAREHGIRINELTPTDESLESVFAYLVGG